jgi:hypothetical protein
MCSLNAKQRSQFAPDSYNDISIFTIWQQMKVIGFTLNHDSLVLSGASNFGGLVITWLLLTGISILASIGVQVLAVTIILAPIGAILMAAYLPLVSAALFARLYRDSIQKLES